METGHVGGGRKPTETSVEELKNIKIILFLRHEPVQIGNFPEIIPFFTNVTSLSAVM